MFLSQQDISTLTGKKRSASQIKALRSMGIEHRIRPDGKVIVSCGHVEELLKGRTPANNNKTEDSQPNWKALS
tara:strand:- start:281 stop:499 length:219 start_codon:yes stop_codon:yes gene_type:complete